MARTLLITLLLACGGCERATPLPLDGPDVFFNGDRLARIFSVELADREAVLKEYGGLKVTGRMQVTAAAELAASVAGGARYSLHGRAPDLYERVDVVYTLYFDDPSVLVHRVKEAVEVVGTVVDASWGTGSGGQSLQVTAVGQAVRRLGD